VNAFGISTELAAARMSALLGPCPHTEAVPVDSCVTGETLAWLCPPPCDQRLPVEWGEVLADRQATKEFRAACTHDDVTDVTNLGQLRRHGVCCRCGQPRIETPDGAWENETT
jgi:hypothetical protein